MPSAQIVAVPLTSIGKMTPSPINPAWIRSGRPSAHYQEIAKSQDGTTWFAVWDCTAGEFEWHYQQDETLVIVGGEVYITANTEQRLQSGDLAYFPAGSSCIWRVPNRIRKIAMIRGSLPLPLSLSARIWQRLKGVSSGRATSIHGEHGAGNIASLRAH